MLHVNLMEETVKIQLQLLVNVNFLNGREMVFVIPKITMLHVNLMGETVKNDFKETVCFEKPFLLCFCNKS